MDELWVSEEKKKTVYNQSTYPQISPEIYTVIHIDNLDYSWKNYFFKEVSSTNDVALNYMHEVTEKRGVIISARHQRKGRGQHGRSWEGIEGNLMATFCCRSFECLSPLSFYVGKILLKGFLSLYPHLSITLKSPNDILIDSKKFCGILIEKHGININIGIGVNIFKNPILESPTTFLNNHILEKTTSLDLLKEIASWLAFIPHRSEKS